MNNAAWSTRLLAALFLLLPLGLGFSNDRLALELASRKAEGRALESARQIADAQFHSQTAAIQVGQALEQFQTRAQRILRTSLDRDARPRLRALHRRLLRRRLPPHDLVVCRYDGFRRRVVPVFSHSSGLGLSEPLAGRFLSGCLEQYLPPRAVQQVMVPLQQILHFPLTPDIRDFGTQGMVSVMNVLEGCRGFFWDLTPRITSGHDRLVGLTACVLDFERLPRDYPVRLQISNWQSGESGLGFLRVGTRQADLSRFFRRFPGLGRRAVTALVARPEQELTTVIDGVLIHSPAPAPGRDIRFLVGVPVADPGQGQLVRYPWTTLQGLVLAGLGMLVLLRTRVFGGGWRLPVGVVLGMAFLLVVLGPGAGVLGVGQTAAAEKEDRDRQETARRLHHRLRTLDQVFLGYQARTVQAMRRVVRHPLALEYLREDARTPDSNRGVASLPHLLTTLSPHLRSREEKHSYSGVVISVGSAGFCRSWNFAEVTKEGDPAQGNLATLVMPFARKAWANMERRRGVAAAPPAQDDRLQLGAVREEMVFDELRRLMGSMFGSDLYTRLLFSPEQQVEMRMNLGRMFVLNTLVQEGAVPQFLVTWVYDEFLTRSAFIEGYLRTLNQGGGEAVFLTNLATLAGTSVPPGIEKIPHLHALVERSRSGLQARQAIRQTPDGDVLYETMPSQRVSYTLYSGTLAAGNLARRVRRLFQGAVAGGFAAAAGLALAAALFFLAPLRRMLEALQRFRPGQPAEPLADAHRADEFGTLAAAFNSMVEGLRQKDLLGRFVSGTVRRLVADEEFRQRAQAGETREVTILFSGLAGLEEEQGGAAPDTVFQWLERHWALLHEVVEEVGGEINKVMGDKILVVFDHQLLGGAGPAATAALRVAGTLHDRLVAGGLPAPEIGINAGTVIAGLMGSPNFRLDYTVIGDTVNLAARLATLAHAAGGSRIVLAGSLVPHLPPTMRVTRLPFTRVKGKTQEVEAYRLELDAGGAGSGGGEAPGNR